MVTALITGGTSGIGAAFARQLAAEGYDLVLVARDSQRLAAAAELHARSGIHVEVISADLAVRADLLRVAGRVQDSQRPITVLINNAGIGVHESLTVQDYSRHEHAFDVMCRAVFVLGGAAGRAMGDRGAGSIINISSLQTFLATGAYGAIKAWVTSYSQGLAVELSGTGVTVTAVLPGWVRTEWHERAGVRRASLPSWLWTSPELVARVALRDARRGRVMSIPTVRYRVLGWWARHLPHRVIRWISKQISSQRQDSAVHPTMAN
ncbi:MAG: SDR family NAD(P)-dependent oxidoreductase [Rhodoglobus sp.]